MKSIRRTVLVACTVFAIGACGAEKAAAHRAEGVVQSLDPAAGQVTIEHGEIPGLMGAMTMTFDVADAALLQGIEPGSQVHFAVEYEDGKFTLTELAKK